MYCSKNWKAVPTHSNPCVVCQMPLNIQCALSQWQCKNTSHINWSLLKWVMFLPCWSHLCRDPAINLKTMTDLHQLGIKYNGKVTKYTNFTKPKQTGNLWRSVTIYLSRSNFAASFIVRLTATRFLQRENARGNTHNHVKGHTHMITDLLRQNEHYNSTYRTSFSSNNSSFRMQSWTHDASWH